MYFDGVSILNLSEQRWDSFMGGGRERRLPCRTALRSFTHDYGRGTDNYRRCKVTCLVYTLQDDESEHHDIRLLACLLFVGAVQGRKSLLESNNKKLRGPASTAALLRFARVQEAEDADESEARPGATNASEEKKAATGMTGMTGATGAAKKKKKLVKKKRNDTDKRDERDGVGREPHRSGVQGKDGSA